MSIQHNGSSSAGPFISMAERKILCQDSIAAHSHPDCQKGRYLALPDKEASQAGNISFGYSFNQKPVLYDEKTGKIITKGKSGPSEDSVLNDGVMVYVVKYKQFQSSETPKAIQVMKMAFICCLNTETPKRACFTDENFGCCVALGTISTSNATRHMKERHSIITKRNAAVAANSATFEAMNKVVSNLYRVDPARFYRLVSAQLCANHAIPFNLFKTSMWNLLQRHLPVPKDTLKDMDVRQPIAECYNHIKSQIAFEIQEARVHYHPLPFLSIQIDLITDNITSRKYVSVKLTWMFKNILKSRILALREYSPSYMERQTEEASKMLGNWVIDVLKEVGVKVGDKVLEGDLLTGPSDSGPDVKKAVTDSLKVLREWCYAHLLNCTLQESYGSSVDKTKSKNPDVREMIDAARKVVETVSKSNAMATLLKETCKKELGQYYKIVNSPVHRWGAIEEVLENLLRQMKQIQSVYRQLNKELPMALFKHSLSTEDLLDQSSEDDDVDCYTYRDLYLELYSFLLEVSLLPLRCHTQCSLYHSHPLLMKNQNRSVKSKRYHRRHRNLFKYGQQFCYTVSSNSANKVELIHSS